MHEGKQPQREAARRLAEDSVAAGRPLDWFDPLYKSANRNPMSISWADMKPNPGLVEWAATHQLSGHGKNALVVGCGLGDDAEFLQELGFGVTGFDISPTAIEWASERFPISSVTYVQADLFDVPAEWWMAFDFVFEGYTLQVLPPSIRPDAVKSIAALVAKGGELLAVARGRDQEEPSGALPWALTIKEFADFETKGLHQLSSEDYCDDEGVRRFRALYGR